MKLRLIGKAKAKILSFINKGAKAASSENIGAVSEDNHSSSCPGNAALKRQYLVDEYIRGSGIEIGALHSPVRVPQNVTIHYVDRLNVEQLRQHYPELNDFPLVHVDIIDNGEILQNIGDSSQDFVIANHFLEHCQNPLYAIENMLRVLKKSGVLYMAIPDKRYTFDSNRPVTSYEHLLDDYEDGGDASRKQHFEEWVRLVLNRTDEQDVMTHMQKLMEIDYSIHYHAWTQTEMIEMILILKKKFEFDIETICFNANEVIFVLRNKPLGQRME